VSPAERVIIAVKLLSELRINIERAGGRYHGSMAPNLQSIDDVLTLPEAFLDRHIPVDLHWLLPTEEEVIALMCAWRS
jgi:hypothetical protein